MDVASVDGGQIGRQLGRPRVILLEDRSSAEGSWARSVSIPRSVVVDDKLPVVWEVLIETGRNNTIRLLRRYSEIDALRTQLLAAYPNLSLQIPSLPDKSVVAREEPRFLESRRRGLEYFLLCILLNPHFASTPIVKDFVSSR